MKTKKLADKNLKKIIITIIGILLVVIINSWTVLQGEIIRKTPTHTAEGGSFAGTVAGKLILIGADVCMSISILIGCICFLSPPKSKRTKTIFVVSICLYLLIGTFLACCWREMI